MSFDPKGPEAAALRKRKFDLLRALRIPPEALPGSLCQTHRRCGKPTCHCAGGKGHPIWTLTFMVDGKKRVERIPEEWLDNVRNRVDAGRALKEAIAEVLAANAQLLVLSRQQKKR